MACAPEPQTRFTVIDGTDTGTPPAMAACRAGFILFPAWMTLPMTTLSISPASSQARRKVSRTTTAPSSVAEMVLSDPLTAPIAVRTGLQRTTSRVAIGIFNDALPACPSILARIPHRPRARARARTDRVEKAALMWRFPVASCFVDIDILQYYISSMKVTVEVSEEELKDILRATREKRKGAAIRQLALEALMLRKRRELLDEVEVGQSSVDRPPIVTLRPDL